MGKFPPMPKEVAEQMKSRAPLGHSPSGIYDLHHSILKKSDVMGLPNEQKAKIHSVFNLIKLPHESHASHARIPSREEAIAILYKREGAENVISWYNSIVWKSGRPPFYLTAPETIDENSEVLDMQKKKEDK